MRFIISTILLATLTAYLSFTFAAPAPQSSSIPVQGLPTSNIACVTSKESTTWTPSTLNAMLQFPSTSAAQTTSFYYPLGVVAVGNGYSQAYPIGPNPNIPPQFPLVCNTDTVLYYVQLQELDTPSTDDVAVYTVEDEVIYFCGVLTDSDNQVENGQIANGFHQCNAV